MPQEIKRKKKKKPTFTQKKENRKRANITQENNWGHFCPSNKSHSLPLFSPHFGEKTVGSHHIFFFSPSQPNTLQKVFRSHFLFLFLFFNYKFFSSSLKSTLLNTPLKTVWIKEKMRVSGEK